MSVLIVSPKQIALVATYAVEQRKNSYELWASIVAEKFQEETIPSCEMDLAHPVIDSVVVNDNFAKRMHIASAIVRMNFESYISRYSYTSTLEDSCIQRPDLLELAEKLDSKKGTALDHCSFVNEICKHYMYFVQGCMIGQSILKEAESLNVEQYQVWLKSIEHQLCDAPSWEFSIANALVELETMNFKDEYFKVNSWMIS